MPFVACDADSVIAAIYAHAEGEATGELSHVLPLLLKLLGIDAHVTIDCHE